MRKSAPSTNRIELAGYSLLYPHFDGSRNKRRRPLYHALEHRP